MESDSFRFLQEAVGKPEWVSTIEKGSGEDVVSLARENGYDLDLARLRSMAAELVHGTGEPGDVTKREIEEAAESSAGFSERGGYGSDSGFGLMSGLAAALLKK